MRTPSTLALLGRTLGLVVLLVSPSFAATWVVFPDGTGDAPTIPAAMDSASTGDEVLVMPGVYSWSSQGASGEDMISVTPGVEVRSASGPAATIIDAEGMGRVIASVGGDATTVIEGFTITGGAGTGHGGGIFLSSSDAVVRGNVIHGNTSVKDGAGVYTESGSPTIEDDVVHSNHSGRYGGGVATHFVGTLSMQGCILYDNESVERGGGLYVNATSTSVDGCTFVSNVSSRASGIMVWSGTTTVDRCIVAYGNDLAVDRESGSITASCTNLVSNAGGDWTSLPGQEGQDGNFSAPPLFCGTGERDLTLRADSPCLPGNHPLGTVCGQIGALGEGCPVSEGARTWYVTADGLGDAPTIRAAVDSAAFGDTVLVAAGVYPWATQGGPGYAMVSLKSGVPLLSESGPEVTILDAQGLGAVIRARDVSSAVEGFTITGGVKPNGAGVFLRNASVTVRNNIIVGNTATFDGGGIFAKEGATLLASDNVIHDNQAARHGGGVQVTFSTFALARNVIHHNTATVDGGGIRTYQSEGTISGCTVADNASPVGSGISIRQNDEFPETTIDRCIVAYNPGGRGIYHDGWWSDPIDVDCSNSFGNGLGEFPAGDEGTDGNFSLPPLFCDRSAGDYGLATNSPCLDGQHPNDVVGCGRLGALGEGCGEILPRVWLVKLDGTGDAPTISAAIDSAGASEIVRVEPGTYTRTTEGAAGSFVITMKKGVILESVGGPEVTIIDAEGTGSVLTVPVSFSDTRVSGFTLTGAVAGGVSYSGSSAMMADCRVVDNLGGGVSLTGGATFRASGSHFSRNEGDAAIAASSATLVELRDCVLEDNSSRGLLLLGADLRLEGTRFEGNSGDTGGALSGYTGGAPGVIDSCQFIGNTADRGGAIRFGSPLEVTRTLFARNVASDRGGAMDILDFGGYALEACTFASNEAGDGAHIYSGRGVTGIVTRCILAGGRGGAAIDCRQFFSETTTISCSLFHDNDGPDSTCPPVAKTERIHEDPGFCDPQEHDYALASDSPALPGNHPLGAECGLIGAFDVGCGPQAATYLVRADGGGDFPTIVAAVLAAADRDTIDLADGVYTGPGNRDIDPEGRVLVIRSRSGDPSACIIDCQGTAFDRHRAFVFRSGETGRSRIEGVTIRNGYVAGTGWPDNMGGAIRMQLAAPTVRNCVFENNRANHGGAISCVDPLLGASIESCVFVENDASSTGGGLRFSETSSVVDSCHFEANSAALGGAVHLTHASSSNLRTSTLIENVARQDGGGIWVRLSEPELESLTLVENESLRQGGGVFLAEGAATNLRHSIVAYSSGGAGVDCDGSAAVTIECSDLFGNAGGDWTTACVAGQLGVSGNIAADPLFCGPGNLRSPYTLAEDSPCAPPQSACGLIGAWMPGCDVIGVETAARVPRVLALGANRPNPFNPATRIAFEVPVFPGDPRATLRIYDVQGRVVRTLIDGPVAPGTYSVTWDGQTDDGTSLPSGVFFYELRHGKTRLQRRMTLIR